MLVPKLVSALIGSLGLFCLSVFTSTEALAATSASVPHAQPCNDHMQAPWVALYSDAHFRGSSICFLGRGRVDLDQYPDWLAQASSVNIGANGTFYESPWVGTGELPFHYGMQFPDLTSNGWNDRITTIQINS